MTQIN